MNRSTKTNRLLRPFLLSVLPIVLCLWTSGIGLLAQQRKQTVGEKPSGGEKGAFKALGKLGKRFKKTDFFLFQYVEKEGRKTNRKKVWLKIPEKAPILQERLGRPQEIKEGNSVYIFGNPQQTPTRGPGGVIATDYSIRRAKIIAIGKEIKINSEYRDPKEKDLRWCEAQVEKPPPAFKVSYTGQSYNVNLDRHAPVVIREEVKNARKGLRSGATVVVGGKKISQLPEGRRKNDPEEAFEVQKIILLDRRLVTQYGRFLSL